MSTDPEIDVEALRTELDQIRDAMGIEERYPSQFRVWPVWGVLVLAASLASQYVFLEGLPPYLHGVVWFGCIGLGGVYQWRTVEYEARAGSDAKPDAWLQVGSIFAVYAVYVAVLGPALDALPDDTGSVMLFSLIIALVGAAYLVLGNTMKAYYIRRRDRLTFYVGGLWMLVLAVLIPNVPLLQRWGYAAYGLLFAAHSLASYVFLSRTD